MTNTNTGVGSMLGTFATLLFVFISASTLQLLGWRYAGGGSELVKLHPGTYLLIMSFVGTMLFDPRQRELVFAKVQSDLGFMIFAIASAATALYAVMVKGTSITPFIETFGTTFLVFLLFTSLPEATRRTFRICVDAFMLLNIGIIVAESISGRNIIPVFVYDPTVLGAGRFTQYFGRPAAFFGHPLTASTFLCIYAIANIMRQTSLHQRSSARFIVASASLFAAVLTAGRASFVAAVISLLVMFGYTTARGLMTGSIRKSEFETLFVLICGGLIAIPLALEFGVFDLLFSRFQYDAGSALARQYALQILSTIPSRYLLLGTPPDAILAQQQNYGLIAIEISWVNFILACGLVFTIPLFTGYVLFLVGSMSRYCRMAFVPALFFMIVESSSIGLWSKSTTMAASIAIILAYVGKVNVVVPRPRPARVRPTVARSPVGASRSQSLLDPRSGRWTR